MMFSGKKHENNVGLDVVICAFDVFIECEAWPTWTGDICGLSGSDVILSS